MSIASYDRKEQAAHHFTDLDAQHEAGKEGVWIFMATEIMMFGGLFVGYFIYRFMFPEAYMVGGDSLNWKLGALNTVVLLLSSFTMAQAVTETMKGNNKKAFKLVVFTTLCAGIFMVVKYFEYSHKIHDGKFPGAGMYNAELAINGKPAQGGKEPKLSRTKKLYVYQNQAYDVIGGNQSLRSDADFALYNPETVKEAPKSIVMRTDSGDREVRAVDGSALKLFYVLYFCMTGLHGLHITIGIGLMIWLMRRLKNNEFGPKYYTAVEGVGLYWHIVDVIWIFLFPLMYLI